MISYIKIALVALIGSVFLTAVLVAGGPIEEPIAAVQDATQSTTSRIFDIGRGFVNGVGSMVKPVVDNVKSHFPSFVGGANKEVPNSAQTTEAPAQVESKVEQPEAQAEKKQAAQTEEKQEAKAEQKEEAKAEEQQEAQADEQQEAQAGEQQEAQTDEQQAAQVKQQQGESDAATAADSKQQ